AYWPIPDAQLQGALLAQSKGIATVTSWRRTLGAPERQIDTLPEGTQHLAELSQLVTKTQRLLDMDTAAANQEGLSLTDKALELSRQVLGNQSSVTIDLLGRKAAFWERMGGFQDAIPARQQVVDLNAARYGRRHPQTAFALQFLAGTYECKWDCRAAW